MTTEHTAPETAQSRVEITTNEKGEARVSVKVYVPASWSEPLTSDGVANQVAWIGQIAADTVRDTQVRVRANGGRVAGDPVKVKLPTTERPGAGGWLTHPDRVEQR